MNDDELYRHPTQGIKHGDSIELMCYDNCTKDNFLNGKVIGEFVCDDIIPMSIEYSDSSSRIALREFPFTCLTDKQIMDYLGNGKKGYGWHISDLKIYKNLKSLNDFRFCNSVKERLDKNGNMNFVVNNPPQSWFYVQEVN